MNFSQAPSPPPVIFQHPGRPTWGRCIIVAERDGKVFLQCEDGQEHAIAQSHRASLTQVAVEGEEADRIGAVIQGRKPAPKKTPSKKKKPTGDKPPRLSFDGQVERFSGLFPGGFAGEAFTSAERKTRQAAIDGAREALSAATFSQPDAFQKIGAFLGGSNLLHPMEGQVPFRSMPAEAQAEFVKALGELLHGSGDHAARYDAFVAAVKIPQPDGTIKRPSWPFTTIFSALHAPAEHVFVKPKLLLEQASILGVAIDYQPLPTGKAYDQFRELLRSIKSKLEEAGQAPRDLMDAGTFVWTTLAPQAPVVAAPEAQPTA